MVVDKRLTCVFGANEILLVLPILQNPRLFKEIATPAITGGSLFLNSQLCLKLITRGLDPTRGTRSRGQARTRLN